MHPLLRQSAQKVLDGLLFGIGFGLILGALYYFITAKIMGSVWDDTAVGKVVVTSQQEVRQADGGFILGSIANHGTDIVRMPVVEADLMDKSGKFVDQCSEHVRGAVQPGESRNFKMTCGTPQKPVAEHDTFKLRIVGL